MGGSLSREESRTEGNTLKVDAEANVEAEAAINFADDREVSVKANKKLVTVNSSTNSPTTTSGVQSTKVTTKNTVLRPTLGSRLGGGVSTSINANARVKVSTNVSFKKPVNAVKRGFKKIFKVFGF